MAEAMLVGLLAIFQWPAIIYPLLGTLLGMLFGALPGLGGPTVLAVLVPLTFGMDPFSAVVLLASALGGVSFGASIPAILINTPGDSPNAATCFDGYPLARQGKAGLALGASASASALGAIFGVILLVAMLPFAREMILAFSYAEIFMLAILGLSVIALVSEGDMLRGLVSGGLGLMLSFIGQNPVNGGLRFTFGLNYLWDGIQLVPMLIGLFAVSEAMQLYIKGGTVADSAVLREQIKKITGVMEGAFSVFRHFGVFLSSSLIGTIIGIIPGVGGTVANFLAYGQTVRMAREPKFFGKGDIRGVIASEASNDSKDGGALLPTLVFGLPGSASMAVLLGGFVLQGIAPGPQLIRDHMDLVFSLIWALIISNILTSAIGLGIARHLSWVTLIRVSLLSPLIFVVSLVGAYSLNFSAGDVVVATLFGYLGYWLNVNGFPKVPIIIGLILGQTVEQAFHFTLLSRGVTAFITRPISLILLLMVLAVLLMPMYQRRQNKRTEVQHV